MKSPPFGRSQTKKRPFNGPAAQFWARFSARGLKRAVRWLAVAALLLAQGCVVYDCVSPFFEFSESGLVQVLSNGIQVIAGLYGITLTGYIFFMERLDSTAERDETLYDVIELLKHRYNRFVVVITVNSLTAFILGSALILRGLPQRLLSQPLYRFALNETLLFMGTAVCFICWFVLAVVDPEKIRRMCAEYKERLSSRQKNLQTGDLEQFLTDCSRIEALLLEMADSRLHKVFSKETFRRGKPQMRRSMDVLRAQKRLSDPLWEELDRLRQYRNYTLHSGELTVSQEMCRLAAEVRQTLEQKAANERAPSAAGAADTGPVA